LKEEAKVRKLKDQEKSTVKKLLALTERVVMVLNPENSDEISRLIDNFSNELQKVLSYSKPAPQQIWKQFPNMTEAQIIAEFNDVEKYPDIESIKKAVKGYLDLHKAGKVKTRETLIKHILETYHRGSFISGSRTSDK